MNLARLRTADREVRTAHDQLHRIPEGSRAHDLHQCARNQTELHEAAHDHHVPFQIENDAALPGAQLIETAGPRVRPARETSAPAPAATATPAPPALSPPPVGRPPCSYSFSRRLAAAESSD